MNPIIPLGNARVLQIVMNFIPLLGVMFFDWSVFALIYAFWLETLGISFLNAIRIFTAKKDNTGGFYWFTALRYLFVRCGILLFYMIFILVFIGVQISTTQSGSNFASYLLLDNPTFRLTVITFFLIKSIEMVYHTFVKGERFETSAKDFHPISDGRTIVIHLVIVLGVFAHQFFSEKLDDHAGVVAFAVVFVLVKTIAERVAEGFSNKTV